MWKRNDPTISELNYFTNEYEILIINVTQRAFLRVILLLNLIVPVDEMVAVESMGRLTFGINDDDEVGEKLWIRCNVGCSAIQNPWFRRSRINRRVMTNKFAAFINASLLPLSLSE